MTGTPDHSDLRRFLGLLYRPGDVFEVRAPKCRQRAESAYTSTVSGYFAFEAIDRAVAAIAELDESALAPGVYVTLSPVRPDLLARAANRLRPRAAETTADADVPRRRWVLVDVDPVRPSGVSATDAELELARERAEAVRAALSARGWPAPAVAMSGNGYHLLYRADLPADDGGLVRGALDALAAGFGDGRVAIDRSVFNPARIVKAVGTVARKGDDLRGQPGVEDRPHRRSRLVDVPATIDTVTVAQLEALADSASPAGTPRADATGERFPTSPAGVRAWLEARGVPVRAERAAGDKTLLLLDRCPVDPGIVSEGGSDIAVLVGGDGKLAYCNKHNRGRDFTWHDLRRAIDPDYAARPAADAGVDLSGLVGAGAGGESDDGGRGAPPPRGAGLTPFVASPPPPPDDPLEPAFVCAADLHAQYPALRPPVIHRLLREGETMNVIAAPKTGKSWLTLDLALSVASGRPWLGRYPTEPGEVLILDNELHRETSASRVPQVARARGLDFARVGRRVAIDNLRGRLRDIFALRPYFDRLEPGRFRLVVLDAFYRFMPMGGDENDNATMANVYNAIDAYADRLGCAFVLIHHSTKGNQSGKSVTDVGAGAGAQSRATDTHLVLRPHEEEGCVVLDAAVRSWAPIEPAGLRWSFPVWDVDETLDPALLKSERPKRARPEKEDRREEDPWDVGRFVETFISDQPASKAQIREAAKDAPGLSWRRVADLLEIAETEGRVRRRQLPGRGGPVGFVLAGPDAEVGDA